MLAWRATRHVDSGGNRYEILSIEGFRCNMPPRGGRARYKMAMPAHRRMFHSASLFTISLSLVFNLRSHVFIRFLLSSAHTSFAFSDFSSHTQLLHNHHEVFSTPHRTVLREHRDFSASYDFEWYESCQATKRVIADMYQISKSARKPSLPSVVSFLIRPAESYQSTYTTQSLAAPLKPLMMRTAIARVKSKS